jgi:hypothetical protein
MSDNIGWSGLAERRRLQLAAPDLLATLEALVISHRALCDSPSWDEQDEAEQAQARAIIAYAKGELK